MPERSARRLAAALLAVALSIAHFSAAHVIAPQADAGSAFFSSAPRFSLPWAEGQSWRLTGGPHSYSGRGRPWSSLDFAGPLAGGSYRVTAAAPGIVSRPCPNMIRIKHINGWMTSYYHVKDIRVRVGQRVKRGQLLGFTSTRAGCGGSATGPHVHFTMWYRGEPVNVRGLRIGGWKVREGTEQYYGCLVRDGTWRCFPGAYVRNFGI